MTRVWALAVAVTAVCSVFVQPADAAGRGHAGRKLAIASTVVGAGTTAGYFALNDWNWKWDSARHGITQLGAITFTTIGCMALSPMVGTVVLNRPLTYREAHVMMGSCLIPFIGGWLVNQAYEHHVLWAPDEPQAAAVERRHWTKHAHR
jgi:hypothetical protein